MKQTTIAVSDCDHLNMLEEEAICQKYGLELVLFQCRTEEDLIANLAGYPAVLNQYAPFTERVFASLPDLKVVVRYGVGVNNIDLAAASRHGVAVCNVPDYGIQEVASHAFALMMTLTRKIAKMDQSVKSGQWEYAHSIPIRRYRNLTVGVVGLGRIGSCFSQLLQPLGCRVLGYDINSACPTPSHVERVDLETLLASSDIISIHTNLETSRYLFDREVLAKMKPGSYLINVSRGGIIQEDALADALNTGHLAGAGIDVVEQEPLPASSPLLTAQNILLTPHMAWYSEESSSDLKTKTAEEAARYLTGQPLRNQLN